jgi:hypothetical protein
MNPRDRKLRTARRLAASLAATGVAGSLGVAGLVALSSLQNGSTSATTTTNPGTSSQQSTVQQQVRPPTRGDDDGFEQGDDDFSFPATGSQTQTRLQPPTLQPGSGVPQASTSGS